jgi:hypothetical protein
MPDSQLEAARPTGDPEVGAYLSLSLSPQAVKASVQQFLLSWNDFGSNIRCTKMILDCIGNDCIGNDCISNDCIGNDCIALQDSIP